MGRKRKYPDHPLWAEIDKLIAEGKPVPRSLRAKVAQSPNAKTMPKENHPWRRDNTKRNRARALKRAGKAKQEHEEKLRRQQIARDPKTFKPLKKKPKKCEHPSGKLSLVSHRGSAMTGDFVGWYRCMDCREMIRVEKKVSVNA